MDQQKQIQALSDEYSGFQTGTIVYLFHIDSSIADNGTELSTLIAARQKLESQQQENKSVQNEFATIADDASIYKLVGPVLLKQETTEAKSTVDGRLEYIEKEIKRIEGSIKEMQEKSEGKKMQIMQLQSQAQQAAGQA